jgi:myo-inositol-1(or 4)-monophosphatase
MIAEKTSFALRLADLARRETLGRWASGCDVEDKSSGGAFDPVTEADREAERAMRSLIEQEYPDHGIAGEEFGPKLSSSRYRWSLDPIDGTRSFTCGLPTWVTLISMLEDEVPILGVIDAPCLDERYVGCDGAAWLHARGSLNALQASQCRMLSHARLSTTDPSLFSGTAADAFEQVRTIARTVRYGHDGYAYARLAAGTIDLVIEGGLKEHDYQALIPVVRGAGGIFGDWSGSEDFSTGKVIAAATPELYEAAVGTMGSAA